MLLNITERVALMSVLPEKANFVTMKIVGDLKLRLGFTNKEITKFKIVHTDTNIKWDAEKSASEREIELLPTQMGVICDSLRLLDQNNSLLPFHLSAYEKFMGNGTANG